MNGGMTIRFRAVDTWFFRESRPFESIGGSELGSHFPPPVRTVAGAVRTLVGEASGVDWADFKARGKDHPVAEQIGYGDDMGPLSFSGPWLSMDGRGRLYPAPAILLSHGETRKTMELQRLAIGAPSETDLGCVPLPCLLDGQRGFKSLESAWLTARGLNQLLLGEKPENDDIIFGDELFIEEPRLGIARSNQKRTVEPHLLYQTRHIRPKPEMSVEIDVGGLDDSRLPRGHVRFGGEGRLAAVERIKSSSFPVAPDATGADVQGVILFLLTHADFGSKWFPPGFQTDKENGMTAWKGTVNGIGLTLRAAVISKAQREGGWNLAEGKPRVVKSLVPAGSAFYCTVDSGDIPAAVNKLRGTMIAGENSLGLGLVAAGLWRSDEFLQDLTQGDER